MENTNKKRGSNPKMKLLENKLRKMVREELSKNSRSLKEGYSFLLKGPNDLYKLKSYFSAATPKEWNDILLQDAKFMKLCQSMVSYLETLEK